MMEAEILTALDAGGNLATMAVMFMLWKMDRRVYRLELKAGVMKGE